MLQLAERYQAIIPDVDDNYHYICPQDVLGSKSSLYMYALLSMVNLSLPYHAINF